MNNREGKIKKRMQSRMAKKKLYGTVVGAKNFVDKDCARLAWCMIFIARGYIFL